MPNQPNVTAKEQAVLDALYERRDGSYYSDDLIHYVKGVTPKELPGVVSSLVKKGFAEKFGDDAICLSEFVVAGKQYANGPNVYLINFKAKAAAEASR